MYRWEGTVGGGGTEVNNLVNKPDAHPRFKTDPQFILKPGARLGRRHAFLLFPKNMYFLHFAGVHAVYGGCAEVAGSRQAEKGAGNLACGPGRQCATQPILLTPGASVRAVLGGLWADGSTIEVSMGVYNDGFGSLARRSRGPN